MVTKGYRKGVYEWVTEGTGGGRTGVLARSVGPSRTKMCVQRSQTAGLNTLRLPPRVSQNRGGQLILEVGYSDGPIGIGFGGKAALVGWRGEDGLAGVSRGCERSNRYGAERCSIWGKASRGEALERWGFRGVRGGRRSSRKYLSDNLHGQVRTRCLCVTCFSKKVSQGHTNGAGGRRTCFSKVEGGSSRL